MDTVKNDTSPAGAGTGDSATQQHTPGPWHVDRLGKVRCENEGGLGFIADPGDGRYANSIPRNHAVSLANARLIAAAPDLLTALQDMLELCQHANGGAFSNGVTDATGSIDEGEVIAGKIEGRARAALAKATS